MSTIVVVFSLRDLYGDNYTINETDFATGADLYDQYADQPETSQEESPEGSPEGTAEGSPEMTPEEQRPVPAKRKIFPRERVSKKPKS